MKWNTNALLLESVLVLYTVLPTICEKEHVKQVSKSVGVSASQKLSQVYGY